MALLGDCSGGFWSAGICCFGVLRHGQIYDEAMTARLTVDEKALAAVMKDWHEQHGVWKDMTIRSIVESYIDHANKESSYTSYWPEGMKEIVRQGAKEIIEEIQAQNPGEI